jgi:tetratricopeptide (TPR) repeat protein
MTFQGEGDLTAALGAARRAVGEDPASLAGQLMLGDLCAQIGYAQQAVGAFEAAFQLAPRDASVLRKLADAYRRKGRAKEALVAADTAVGLEPQSAAGYLCVGDALLANEAPLAADRAYCRALALDPHLALAECGRGAVCLFDARWDEAGAAFSRALALEPGCAEARYNRALIDLRFGRYRSGFADYPAIMHTAEQRPRYHYYHAGVPLWDGTPLDGRRLVIAFEMGLGNQIMMARFFRELPQFGERIAVETPPALHALLARSFPALSFVRFTDWQPLDVMDAHLPFMQLPAVLKVARESDFSNCVPYLVPDPARVAAMRERLQLERGVRHVGIVWHGNRDNARDRWRAAPLPAWAPLAAVTGVRFHSLQTGTTPAELAQAPFALAPAHELIGDMDDTATIAGLMDLIITVDTSMVHLAGALGYPVWMPEPLQSDYRWGVDRSDSPWYPSLRIFRQRVRDDWQPVFAEIAARL